MMKGAIGPLFDVSKPVTCLRRHFQLEAFG